MSASVLDNTVNNTIWAMLGNVTYASPYTSGDLSSTSFVQTNIGDGVEGVTLSISGQFQFEYPGVYEIDTQLELETPADICSSTGFGGISFQLIPSAGVTSHIKSYTYVQMNGASQVAFPSIVSNGICYVNTSGGTLSTLITFPTGCVGTGNVTVVGGGETYFRVKRLA